MTLAYWCVLIAALMPYVSVGIAKWDRTFDNSDPRGWLAARGGYQARAHAAHLNAFEAFPAFAAAVIIAHLAGVPQARIDALAVVFVAARIAFLYCYVSDRPAARSIVWTLGTVAWIALYVLAGVASV
jgi:uncharacterized MAPEG superfamily protein